VKITSWGILLRRRKEIGNFQKSGLQDHKTTRDFWDIQYRVSQENRKWTSLRACSFEHVLCFTFFIVVLGVHCGIYKSSYNTSNISYLNHPHPINQCSLSPFLHIPGVVSPGLVFPFKYIYTWYLHHIHPPMSFPHFLPSPTATNPLDRICFTFLLSNIIKDEIMNFFLFKMAIQGVSLWHFHVYVCYNFNWFISIFFAFLGKLLPR
jgi:hypothetical protein